MNLFHALADTEYHAFRDPSFTRTTPFGEFVSIPAFPSRHDANQLFNARCRPDEIDTLLTRMDALYPPALHYRKISTHDDQTAKVLRQALPPHGFSTQRCRVSTFDRTPRRAINPEVAVRAVPFDHPHLDRIITENDGPNNGMALRRAQARRLGGEMIIGYLDGEPAGCAGWFVTPQGIARYRPVDTRPAFRNRGVATTLVRYVQDHPTVRAARALCLYCGEDGPWPLYEQLGFVERGWTWEFLRKPAV